MVTHNQTSAVTTSHSFASEDASEDILLKEEPDRDSLFFNPSSREQDFLDLGAGLSHDTELLNMADLHEFWDRVSLEYRTEMAARDLTTRLASQQSEQSSVAESHLQVDTASPSISESESEEDPVQFGLLTFDPALDVAVIDTGQGELENLEQSELLFSSPAATEGIVDSAQGIVMRPVPVIAPQFSGPLAFLQISGSNLDLIFIRVFFFLFFFFLIFGKKIITIKYLFILLLSSLFSC
jgi:hypothetical protein